ncbi:MAG TPA: hypothetical protein PLZ27_07480 [Bacillota bacterium]|nr:hypothetical protein [Bacillota bacterium]
MGLGLLFLGYVIYTIFTFAPSFFITDIIGCYLMVEAHIRLVPYGRRFRFSSAALYVLFFHAFAQGVYYTLTVLGIIEAITWVDELILLIRHAVLFVYTVVLLLALRELSLSVGDIKLAGKAKRNIYLFAISYVFIITLSLDYAWLDSYKAAFSAFALLFRLVCAILISAYIYSCYMWICPASDHDMKPKESKLAAFFKSKGKVNSGNSVDTSEIANKGANTESSDNN